MIYIVIYGRMTATRMKSVFSYMMKSKSRLPKSTLKAFLNKDEVWKR